VAVYVFPGHNFVKKIFMRGLKFILVDDSAAFRRGLRDLLVSQYDAEIIAEASNSEEMYRIKNTRLADVILMDVMMPGESGIELAKKLLWFVDNNLKIIAVTLHTEEVYLMTLIEAGFKGCIFKNELTRQLSDALKSVMANRLYFPENILLKRKY